jgi:hypothetical protein
VTLRLSNVKIVLSFPLLSLKLSNEKVNKMEEIVMTFIFHGTTVPSGSGPPHCRDFTITLRLTHSVGLLFMSE